ncbi:NADH-ubiquinone oxidoreductase chain [Apis cerana cerana]|uniref:NADH-ubiquinone oxidoreductase chain n=1 Tax=Apis cerana cerana TaxID=94128 RepID=A0A2A3E1R0_APICC|nr:NADH-ubiquinone oxidoreductase chain [Apis cerana cerana]
MFRIIGGYLIIISHGLDFRQTISLFFLVNVIYSQTNRRLIFVNKGSPISLNLISEININ